MIHLKMFDELKRQRTLFYAMIYTVSNQEYDELEEQMDSEVTCCPDLRDTLSH